MPHTAARVLRAATAAILLAAALPACGTDTPTSVGGSAPATTPPATTPPATQTPRVVAPKTQRPADPPGSARPDPCDGVARAGSFGPTRQEPHTVDALYLVRVERKACTDVVVFRVNGTARFGGHAEYVASARAAGSGDPIELRGDAVLEIVIFAPDFANAGGGHQPGREPWRVGQEVAQVPSGTSALREVAYAGPNDGSETVFVIGLRERLPFTIAWRSGDGFSELSVSVAHRAPGGK
ncbi:AMIN-like domain-containing (lipo)protein [Phytohabitans houttuyneae]|uniref:AMIN-like domain-containing protein n=1 Tax=Phytohabitans houttuyneae TaxID=1076126 RepID=A0A6V8KSN2_9ACTN|nr:hypothetical protein [Phytohabitans houttuyneae]GFJ84807.1 hypothetical protein Phou_089870 [Phytohabitans houttuyneae]